MSRGRFTLAVFGLAVPAVLTAQAKSAASVTAPPDASVAYLLVNRVDYGVRTRGTFGQGFIDGRFGGLWPRGTGNAYMFNSGPQVAGVIRGSEAANPWAGDTSGALFFDPSGLREHGAGVSDLYSASPVLVGFSGSPSPSDSADWPQAGYIPLSGPGAERFDPAIRNRRSASDGDLWFMAWEGDPGLNSARPHPLGVAAEFRVMGWNAPRGNEDLLYVVVTFYNISTTDPAAYAAYSPGMREQLLELAGRFQELNETEFGVALPDDGYTIDPFYPGLAADPDVTNSAGTNFSSVNQPLAMGFAWHADFPRASGWTFAPDIFGPPFFSGAGLVGTKFLGVGGARPALQHFSATTNGGAFPDPNSAERLFHYLSGALTPEEAANCNVGDQASSGVCFIDQVDPRDTRHMQSAPAVALPAGGSTTLAWAYVHAAPVQLAGYGTGTRVFPGDPLRMSDALLLAQGANRIDSIAGFTGFQDRNGDGVVQGHEISAVPRSLIQKAQLAQAIFDNRFLLPQPPAAPDFFLIPGERRVTVVWRPSATESIGDPYFEVASAASSIPAGGGPPVPNALYDPNYRRYDVEGYRIYRGRVDSPAALELVAQFDHEGTVMRDYTGQLLTGGTGSNCAPELGVTVGCAVSFDAAVPGVPRTAFVEYPLDGPIIQVELGDRQRLANDVVAVLAADTAITGGASGLYGLSDTGVPYAWVDEGLRDGLTYFYAVTAFDLNSVSSTGRGRTSTESARVTRRVQPGRPAGNLQNTASVTVGVFGRNGLLPERELPTLDPVTGKFSGPFPPTNAVTLELVSFVKEVLAGSGEVAVTVDSMTVTGFQGASFHDVTWHYTIATPSGVQRLSLPVHHSSAAGTASVGGEVDALTADPALAARHGAPPGSYTSRARYAIGFPAGYYTGVKVRGCVNGVFAFAGFPLCDANGPRWFMGTDNVTMRDNPNGANPSRFRTGTERTDFNNVGGPLDGVRTIFEPLAYNDYSSTYRDVHAVLSPFISAADYRVHWGAGGTIDSVIDVVHNVVVPFGEQLGPSWGILNQAATATGATTLDQRSELTVTDIGCVEPIRTLNPGGIACTGPAAALSRTALPGPVAYGSDGTTVGDLTHPAAPGQGFVFYLKGHAFMVELVAGVPAAGTVWTMRDYVGAIGGGVQAAGDGGPQVFSTAGMPRPFSAVGSSVRLVIDLTNTVAASDATTLARVHAVPDPFYGPGTNGGREEVRFVDLPPRATVRIYTVAARLVRVLRHDSPEQLGDLAWNLRDRDGRDLPGGVYFYHVTAENGASVVGRLTVVR